MIGTKIGIAVFVFVLLLIGVVALVVYLYKKQRAGNRGDVQNLEKRNRKSGAFVPDYTGILYFSLSINTFEKIELY